MAAIWPQAGLHHTIVACALLGVMAQPTSVVTVDHDNINVDSPCEIKIAPGVLRDVDGNGVIQITGSDIEIDFRGATLRGANAETSPDQYEGVGVMITGSDVVIRNLNVSGYKVGILATNANRLTIEDCDVSDNFRQRLKSAPQREDSSDWLWPHANDKREWVTNYGAGLCVENASMVTIRRVRARNVQNGIILDRVNRSLVYDNDCSFLSGWGLALWRCNSNQITCNAFDFCIRGYSHGVYNRGQDSAGILMFEQCSDNIISDNSITHGGDGIFAFSGKEALGDVPDGKEPHDRNWYRSRGHRRNIIQDNDCSYAAAHGIELTFGFDNSILANRIVGNAICGVWGGYSHRSIIAGNTIQNNGEMGYGLERGGVNIEHGSGNWVQANTFGANPCAVHLWWDNDEAIAELPWAQVNDTKSNRNVIYGNTFGDDAIAIQLRACDRTFIVANDFGSVEIDEEVDDQSHSGILRSFQGPELVWNPTEYESLGKTIPVGARSQLAGRDKIIMTEWGPYDWQSPLLQFTGHFDGADTYRILGGVLTPSEDSVHCNGDVRINYVDGSTFRVHPKTENTVTPYTVTMNIDDITQTLSGQIASGHWNVVVFPSPVDPREDVERWRKEGPNAELAERLTPDAIDFTFGMAGMSELENLPRKLPHDHFGTIATRSLTFTEGTWRLRTVSDDGIRVWLDDELVIDDWTWHAPKEQTYEIVVKEATTKAIRIEHFELDGYAVLTLAIERVE